MKYIFPPYDLTALPIKDSEAYFPIHRIYCVGRNYASHAREMGSDPQRESPFFFCKPSDAATLVDENKIGEFVYPPASNSVHHEVELVVALGQGGKNIATQDALKHVLGYTIGLDMTRRDLQAEARAKGCPWDVAKAFDGSAPVGPIYPVSKYGQIQQGEISLSVNGYVRQKGSLEEMIWSVAEIISHLSSLFELKAGDLIFTGTPEGVGAVNKGDELKASIAGLSSICLKVV